MKIINCENNGFEQETYFSINNLVRTTTSITSK